MERKYKTFKFIELATFTEQAWELKGLGLEHYNALVLKGRAKITKKGNQEGVTNCQSKEDPSVKADSVSSFLEWESEPNVNQKCMEEQ